MGFRQWLASSILGFKMTDTMPYVARMYANQPQGVYTRRNYAQYFDEAYRKNVIAFQAVRRVAQSCAGLPLSLRMDGKPIEDFGEHPLGKLLRRPNPYQGGQSFLESVFAYLMLSGNTYIEGVGVGDDSAPVELWSLRPDRVRVRVNEKGVDGFIYEVNGAKTTWDADPVTGQSKILHSRFFNPLDDWYGMSPVEAAAYAVDQHNEAGKWNQALLQNGCKPSGALVYNNPNGGSLTEKQFGRLKEELNAAFAGGGNAGRAMILEGAMDWKQFSLSPADMDWINGKHNSAREISLAFGVPPQMLGIPGDSTYSNYQEARQSFYEDTVIPLHKFVMNDINNWLQYSFQGAELVADVSQIPALAPKREKIWTMVTASNFMTTNEKREAVGLPPITDESADKVLIPSGLTPLEDVGAALELDETGMPIEEEEDEAAEEDGEEAMPPKKGKPKPPFPPKKPAVKHREYIWERK